MKRSCSSYIFFVVLLSKLVLDKAKVESAGVELSKHVLEKAKVESAGVELFLAKMFLALP